MNIIKEGVLSRVEVSDIVNAHKYFGMSSELVDCPLATIFLENLPEDQYIVDSRTHMLKPNWYPCIPGWHLDEIYRGREGQLDYQNNNWEKEHYFMVFDFGTGSLTEYVDDLDYPEIKQFDHHSKIDAYIKSHKMEIKTIKPNTAYKFSCYSPHRGTPATDSGWRYFIRATRFTQRPFENKLQTQAQVYIPHQQIDEGW